MIEQRNGKPVIYHVFTRLFGNTNTTNKPWGKLTDNGMGKFSDFTDTALSAIKAYGVSHIWYTGVPHHGLIGHYDGISDDHPDVVKGRAGSPYAVKDYYNVNPDLATNPANRLQEFEALIARSHQHDLKVIIDIVPNHVARNYHSVSAPTGVEDFGANDDTSCEYHRDNNFYYIPGQPFERPDYAVGFEPLGAEPTENRFIEHPAKWTGNGGRTAKPKTDDWYETVKINYGIKPDGSKDFPTLPHGFEHEDAQAHFEFWQQHSLPDSWYKFRDIALYWLSKGVDGFRFDMAEMVPVEFWSFLNSSIKTTNPNAVVIAEVYQPELYREYIHFGKMDYLYDKVDVYDTLKDIVQEKANPARIDEDQAKLADIDSNFLRFLENHDEQRIASPEFAGTAKCGWPAMIITALLGKGPTMLYFGQAQGEKADEDLGFGKASRTTIFDYAGVPAHQAWMNNGRFDGGQLTVEQKQLDRAYQRLLRFSAQQVCLHGDFLSLHSANLQVGSGHNSSASTNDKYNERCYSFIRHDKDQWVLVFVNFDRAPLQCRLVIPSSVIEQLPAIPDNSPLTELIGETPKHSTLISGGDCDDGSMSMELSCGGYDGVVFKLSN